MTERPKAEVNVKTLAECKPSKSQSWKRQDLLRRGSCSDSEEKINDRSSQRWIEAAERLCYRSLILEDPEGADGLLCAICFMWAHTHAHAHTHRACAHSVATFCQLIFLYVLVLKSFLNIVLSVSRDYLNSHYSSNLQS
jgi:hypothetical protein